MESEVYLAFLDILGFKDIILNNSEEVTEEIVNGFIEALNKSVNLIDSGTGDYKVIVNFNLFSDSVALWTDDTDFKSFHYLTLSVANLLNYSIQIGLPLRGAISKGYIKNDTFNIRSNKVNLVNSIYGSSIVKAHKLESKQLWSGCIIDDKIFSEANDKIKNFINNKQLGKFHCKYKVPIKDAGCKVFTVINWVNLDNDNLSEDRITDSFSAHNKSLASESVKIKLNNTLEFYRYVKIFNKIT